MSIANSLTRPQDYHPGYNDKEEYRRQKETPEQLQHHEIQLYHRGDFYPNLATGSKYYESMRNQNMQDQKIYADAQSIQVILKQWLDKESTPVLGLLGEYGMGKTTNLQVFADSLNDRNNKKYTPIFIDLRNFAINSFKNEGSAKPMLDMITDTLNASLHTGEKPWKKEELEQGILHNRVLLIMDGLDEVLVHLNEDEGERFIKKIWTLFPAKPLEQWRQYYRAMLSGNNKVKPKKPEICRLIVSCRSHYFKDFDAQIAMLFDFFKESGMKNEHLALYTLLPFSKEQIHSYLEKKLPSSHSAQAVMDNFKNIHNLMEMAERPVILNFLTEDLDSIDNASQEVIQPIGIYTMALKRWLERDFSKHRIPVDYKFYVMEALANECWKRENASISWEKLGLWLDRFKMAHPLMHADSGNRNTEQWKEDLRTATYIVRPHDDVFAFAHRSFLEFFLARHIWRTFSDRENWDGTPRPDNFWTDLPEKSPSLECLDFLFQFYNQGSDTEKNGFQEALRQALSSRDAQRMYLFQWWMATWQKGLAIDLKDTAIDFSNLELAGYEFTGLKEKTLPLQRVNFSGSNLRDSRFEYCNLKDCQLDNAVFYASTWVGVSAMGGTYNGIKTDFSIYRHCQGDLFESGRNKIREIPHKIKTPLPDNLEFLLQDGHSSPVTSWAWSPDSTRLLSASWDNTVRVWDAQTGELLRTLIGHEKTVTSCAWSPDSTRLLSASWDNTVRVWDAQTGELLRTLIGHESTVNSCAWSPDSTRLLSASRDNSVRVWDALTGKQLKCLHSLQDNGRNIVIVEDHTTGRYSTLSPGAWKYVAFRDAAGNVYPAENVQAGLVIAD